MTTTSSPPQHRRLVELDQQRQALVTEAEGLLERSGDAALEGDDLSRFQTIEAELGQLATRRSQLELLFRNAAAGAVERIDQQGAGSTGPEVWRRNGSPHLDTRSSLAASDDDVIGRARTAIEQTRGASSTVLQRAAELVDADPRGRVARYVLATSGPAYLRAVDAYLEHGMRGVASWTDEQRAAMADVQVLARTLQIGDNSAGGYLMPFTLDPVVMLQNAGTVNPWRALARTTVVAGDNWHGIASSGVTAEWAEEMVEAGDGSPAFTQPSVSVHKAQAFVPVSHEAVDDFPSLRNDLGVMFTDAKDRLESIAFATGSGTAQPWGVITRLNNSASEVAPATPEAYALADAAKLLQELPPRYRPAAVYVGDLSTAIQTKNLAAAADDLSAWNYLSEAPGGMLYGKRYVESSEMRGFADINALATADNHILLLGDFQAGYLVVDRLGLTVEVIENLLDPAHNRPNGTRGFYARWRVGGDVLNLDAFRVLNVATTA